MNSSKEKALASTRAEFETNSNSILTYFIKVIKRKYKNFSILFWRKNYGLEMNRQEHANLGHLWRQIGCCIALSVFRIGWVR